MSENESKRNRGGQPGNQNALKDGFYTKSGRKRFKQVDSLVRDCHALLEIIAEGKDISQFKPNILKD